MPEPIKATSCPHCGKELKIPEAYFGKVLRCKGCHKTFVAGQAKATKAVAEKPTTAKTNDKQPAPKVKPEEPKPQKVLSEEPPVLEPASAPSPLVQQLARRQRTG